MGLLQKLKSALGLNGAESSGSRPSGDVDVTVEREPSTEHEDAVKGTETASSGTPAETADEPAADTSTDTDADAAAESAADTESGADTEAEEADPADAEEAEPADAEEADPADAEEADPADAVEGSTDPVTELNGIGPAYADRLAGVGIETVGELAAADPAEVAEGIELGESRVAGWVEQATDY